MNYQYAIKESMSPQIHSRSAQTAGFRYYEVEEGIFFPELNKDYNHILFMLEGRLLISCNEFSRQIIQGNEFVLIPIAADTHGRAMSRSRALIFSFEKLPECYSCEYIQSLIRIRDAEPYNFQSLTINDSMSRFINLQLLYFGAEVNNSILHEIKKNEFFITLQSFYTRKEVASFLYPVIGESGDFRMRVQRNYRKVMHANIKDFAGLFDMEAKTFSRQFKEEFGMSPYQWLLNEKAKHICFSLTVSNEPLEEIREKYGFKFSSHFTRFCKGQFNCTPLQLRKHWKEKGKRGTKKTGGVQKTQRYLD